MKILVVTPPGRFPGNRFPCPFPSRWTSLFPGYPVFIYFPYELAYLSSLLKKDLHDHDVKMVDGTYLRFTVDDYVKYLEYQKPDWVIFEVDTVTYGETLKIARRLKEKTAVKIVMTGQYSTVYPQRVLEDGNDFACIGEYEETVRDLLRGDDPKTISGLFPNGYRKVLDLDSLPDPEDEDIRRIDYSYPGGCRWTKYREVEIFASRGCPYSCDFCVAGNVYYEKPNWRFRSPERIVNEIETLRRKYPEMEGVFFNEETHIVKKIKILELCDALVTSGNNDLHYEAMANHLILDEEILEAIKKAGYYRLRIGIETTDPETIKSIGIKSKPSKLDSTLKIAKKLGIEMYGTFLIGASGSSKKGDMATIEFGAKLLSEGLISSHQASIAVPHPGTPFHKKAAEKGWLETDNPELFNGVTGSVVSYPNYPKDEIRQSLITLGEKFYQSQQQETVREVKSDAMEKTAILKKDRDKVKKMLEFLSELFLSGEFLKTLREADDILEEFPQLFKPRYIKGSTFERMGKIEEAENEFEYIINTAVDYDDAIAYASGAHFHVGIIRFKMGNRKEAFEHLKKCMHLNPLHEKARSIYWKLLLHEIEEAKAEIANIPA